jgi:hypothetical protein
VLRKLLLIWATDRIARLAHPFVQTYVDMYHKDDGDDPGSGNPEYDRRSTIAGQAEVAANRDHATLEVIAQRRMGFTLPRRATVERED